MLELKTKWFTNTLAKTSMLNKDFILCANNIRLYIVGYGEITSSGKNTYNYQLKDDKGVVLSEGSNAYLDKLTTLVKGENPKTKERKETKDKEADKTTNKFITYKDTLVYKSFLAQEKKLAKAILEMNKWYQENGCDNKQDVINLTKVHASMFNRDVRRSNDAKVERIKVMKRYYKDVEIHKEAYKYLCDVWNTLD